ncbi:IS110 family transposase [Micromonospora sp. MA102]|uniref:IS110 family transposase n=1 Tax=Micromonospora sp. MA102 TaxID=2952755 RepID=UPI0021CAC617|nr:IS110 family transposase [Micromonospora sp. MA102]
MPMLADVVDAVIGGDTHRDSHALELTAPSGVHIATLSITNDEAGFAEALAWIGEHAPGPRVVVALEGTRSYGIGLARALATAGLMVVEVERPRRAERRRGKSDPIDARLAALHALRLDAQRLPTPRADGDREALRILLSARREMVATRTRTVNRLRALLLTGDEADRTLSRGSLTCERLAHIARRRGPRDQTREQAVRRAEARRLALAVRAVGRDLADNKAQLANLVADLAPDLLAKHGVGPVSAAQAIVSWSHPGRCRNEAAYAALAGASPIPASSGRIVRHRFNRGGDRALNRALHDILLTRWRTCPRTQAYVTRRRSEGISDPEIRRCLKRYIARELYRSLNAAAA